MRHLPTTVIFCLLAFGSITCAQELSSVEQPQPSRIRLITLYRDRALVTREISVPAGDPLRTIDVPDLPELIVSDSVFAEGDDRTTVRAVRVSGVPAVESQREEVLALDKQIEEITRQRTETQQMLDVITKDMDSLEQLVSFSVIKGNSDLNHGVLNAETLTSLTTFSMSHRRDLAAQQFQYQMQLADLNKKLELAERGAKPGYQGRTVHGLPGQNLRRDGPRRRRNCATELHGAGMWMVTAIYRARPTWPAEL